MIIQRLEIISFGKFKNKIIDFTDGLNVIYGDNESGKSTVISFIYAMLYGFGDNRGKTLSMREKFTPWDGGVCEGKIVVKADNGESISIYRKAGNAKKYDTLRVYNTDTGEELSIAPEEIVGINSDTFLKTLCIRQLSTALYGSNDEIAQRLSNISSGGDENVSFEKAVRLLDNVRREIQPQRGGGGALANIMQQIAGAEKSRNTRQNITAELEAVRALFPKAEKEAEVLKNEYEQLLRKDYTAAIAHLSGRIEEINRRGVKGAFSINLFIIGAAALFAVFLMTLFIKIKYSFIFLALAIFSALFGFMKKKPIGNNSIAQLTAEKEKLQCEKISHDKKLSLAKERLSSAESRLSQLKIREQTLRLSLTDEDDNLHELYAKKTALEKKLQTVTLAAAALNSAHEKMQKNFTPALNKRASEYFSVICGGKYTRIFCDEQFGIQIDSDIPRESSFFSGGTVDQLYLSVRLALLDMLFKEESCPLILDQPFLQYDEKRKKKTVGLLENLPKNRQILLFTSDKTVISPNKPTEILT